MLKTINLNKIYEITIKNKKTRYKSWEYCHKYFYINKNKGIYWKIKESHSKKLLNKKGEKCAPTDTLITKVLLGTFGCISAVDTKIKSKLKRICFKKRNI